MTKLQQLQAEKAQLVKDYRALIDKPEEELTDEEKASFDDDCDKFSEEIATKTKAIAREEALEKEERSLKRRVANFTDPNADLAGIEVGEDQIVKDSKRGFNHFGEFAAALVNAGSPTNAHVDPRLLIGAAAPGTSFGQEAVGEDGGFVVPPDFDANIRTYALEDDALLPLTAGDTISGNGMAFPVDETTPWGTDGIRAFWEGEAELATKTKPKLERREMRLKKLFGLVPMTDELLADAPAMSSYVPRKLGESIRYKTNDAIVNGQGGGKPAGFRHSGAVVTQTKESAQVADTIVAANVTKMYSRNINPTRAVWLINPDAFPQLPLMTIGDQPIWTAPNQGIQNAPNGLLLGRPLIMHETCQTLGDAGDLYFVALNWYQTITKNRGIETATSMHLWFDYDMMAFRAIFRMDGQSVVRNPVTPPNSPVTRSPFVQLEARA